MEDRSPQGTFRGVRSVILRSCQSTHIGVARCAVGETLAAISLKYDSAAPSERLERSLFGLVPNVLPLTLQGLRAPRGYEPRHPKVRSYDRGLGVGQCSDLAYVASQRS